jgi:ribA/ribD-fused uncharacterized protein
MIFFNSYSPQWGWMSNFWPAPIRVPVGGGFGDKQSFPSAEHLYQFSKWDRRGVDQRELMDAICGLNEVDAASAKRWGRKVRVRPNWEGMKLKVMRNVLREKFAQHHDLAVRLAETDDELLLHLSPWDKFWGVSETRVGLNRLGQLMMQRRELLRTQ